MWTTWIIVLVFGLTQGQIRLDPLVNTKQGLIRGLSANDGDYSMFLGIPYAEVDKDNPFGSSAPYPKFDGVFEAYDDSVVCPQVDSSSNTVVGELDCLNLNIFVPNKAYSQNKLPVLVWIHGGSLVSGSGNRYRYGPKFLVQHDVILVTINYRLGPYGFLCLDVPQVPGNQGIKDQTLAMRWIKDNIAEFGGDASKITVMGESAGASSIDYHLYSNNEVLFNRAILQSGSVFTAWSFSDADASAPLKIAERLGFKTDDIFEALDFLKDTDSKLVISATSELDSTFRVCVEKQFEGVENFLTDRPLNLDLPKVRNMPILSGFNSREQMGEYHSMPASYFKNLNVFYDSLKIGFIYDDDFEIMEDIVRHFYIGDEEVSEAVKDHITDFRSDIDENYPIQKSMKKFLENGAQNVFHYVFSYDGGRNLAKQNSNMTEEGAAHADEIGYLFDYYDKTIPSAEDQRIIDQITTLWTNFAKYGDPTPDTTELLPVKWIPMTLDTYNYLDIDKELVMKKRAFHARMSFWDLFDKANVKKLKGYREN
ncbi:unnamed protein product [Euphydryas editha]|uniref:Carboxylic ester hydrolase n=1 Tax=Euphydryas editha TaxID=104508 RepID=A0AAU9T8Q9_EUPED|nr:unnamed protein product [Euphydryas editha]